MPLQMAAFRGELNQDRTQHCAIMSLLTAALLSGLVAVLLLPSVLRL